jgi:hypothetical protein
MDARTSAGIHTFNKVLAALVIIGALNWGLLGFFQYNLVASLLGGSSQVLYILVGLAGVALAFTFPWTRRVEPREPVQSQAQVRGPSREREARAGT